jgi:hypothetical protein
MFLPVRRRLVSNDSHATGPEPRGRNGERDASEEIASAVLWLCNSGESFVVGNAMVIDDGETV